MTTQHNMPPMPKTWQERMRESWPADEPHMVAHTEEGIGSMQAEITDLRSHAAALAERIVALEAKCTLYAASLKQADERVIALEAEVSEWRKLRDPAALHVNLLRGQPARLQARELLHVAGYTQSEVDAALAAARQPVEVSKEYAGHQASAYGFKAGYRAGVIDARQPVEAYMVDARVIAHHYAAATLLKDQADWPGAVILHFSDNSHAEFAYEVLHTAMTAGMVSGACAAQQTATVDRDAVLEEAVATHEKFFVRGQTTDWGYVFDSFRALKGQPATPPAGEARDGTGFSRASTAIINQGDGPASVVSSNQPRATFIAAVAASLISERDKIAAAIAASKERQP